jgi:hypothetical protein
MKGGFLLLCIPSLFLHTYAQGYSIDSFEIAGGGGTSTNGSFSVGGLIRQPDAGTMSGGTFTLLAGFWPGIVVSSDTGMPTLFIRWSEGDITISWAPSALGFVLEETTNLASSSWSGGPAGNPVASISPTGVARYYRLRKP